MSVASMAMTYTPIWTNTWMPKSLVRMTFCQSLSQRFNQFQCLKSYKISSRLRSLLRNWRWTWFQSLKALSNLPKSKLVSSLCRRSRSCSLKKSSTQERRRNLRSLYLCTLCFWIKNWVQKLKKMTKSWSNHHWSKKWKNRLWSKRISNK